MPNPSSVQDVVIVAGVIGVEGALRQAMDATITSRAASRHAVLRVTPRDTTGQEDRHRPGEGAWLPSLQRGRSAGLVMGVRRLR